MANDVLWPLLGPINNKATIDHHHDDDLEEQPPSSAPSSYNSPSISKSSALMEITQHHSENDSNSVLPTSRFRPRFCNCHWRGVKPIPLIVCVAIGLVIRFAIPKPDKVTAQAWQLLAIFITSIAGLILAPLPVGAWCFVCLTASVITKTLSFQQAFSALENEVIWLIVVAFFFSRGFVKTGLGDRVATYFIRCLGRKTIGLTYGLVLCEALVAAAIPSSTARAGGVFMPVIKSVAVSKGSLPHDKSAKKLGSFLMLSQFQQVGSFLMDIAVQEG